MNALHVKADNEDMLSSILKERNEQVYEVGKIKRKYGKDFLDEARWKDVLEKAISAGGEKGIEALLVEEVWNTMHSISLRIEGLTPEVPEEKQINDDTLYESELSPFREEIMKISTRILDYISQKLDHESDTGKVKQSILDIINDTGTRSLSVYFQKLGEDIFTDEKFQNICSLFVDVFQPSDSELSNLTGGKASAGAFKYWASGNATPSEDMIDEVFAGMKQYIKDRI